MPSRRAQPHRKPQPRPRKAGKQSNQSATGINQPQAFSNETDSDEKDSEETIDKETDDESQNTAKSIYGRVQLLNRHYGPWHWHCWCGRYGSDPCNITRRFEFWHRPRPGHKLLVLDLDKTILHNDSKRGLGARPLVHKFLEEVYPYYDIVLWSDTGMDDMVSDLRTLGIHGAHGLPKFIIMGGADFTFHQRYNDIWNCKASKSLRLLWEHHPNWSAVNTVLVDDDPKNLLFDPAESIQITPFINNGSRASQDDRELRKLGKYLVAIAKDHPDFTKLNHTVS